MQPIDSVGRARCLRIAGFLVILTAVLSASVLSESPNASRATDTRWWMNEPIRFLQTNLSETDSTVAPRALGNDSGGDFDNLVFTPAK